jgi:hypothetical protein
VSNIDLNLDYRNCAGCNGKAYSNSRFTSCIEGMFGMIESIHHFCGKCSHPDQVLPKMSIGTIHMDKYDIQRYFVYINRLYKDYGVK